MTPAVAVQGAAVPVSKPGLPSSWVAVQPPPPPEVVIVQVKAELPEALVVSLAVTDTE
jgi:hypothetical protein